MPCMASVHLCHACHACHNAEKRRARVRVLVRGLRGDGPVRDSVQLCACSSRRCVPYCASRVRVRVRVRVREGVRALARAENDGS